MEYDMDQNSKVITVNDVINFISMKEEELYIPYLCDE